MGPIKMQLINILKKKMHLDMVLILLSDIYCVVLII